MFSENGKISAKQMKALLLTDWMGKLLLLTPELPGEAGAGGVLAGILTGTLLALGIAWMAGEVRDQREDYYGWICRILGKPAASVLFFLMILYLTGQVSLVFWLCGQIAGTYLLPETNRALLILFPALPGCYLAWSGLETAGRVSELTAPLLWGLFFLMLALTLPQLQPDLLAEGMTSGMEGIWSAAGCTALAGFGTLSALPLILFRVTDTEHKTGERAVAKKAMEAVLLSGLLLLFFVTAGYGILGTEGMGRLRWPVIPLMSCVNLQGVFLQRWDVLLVGLLAFSLFLSAGSGIFYAGIAGACLTGIPRKPVSLAAAALSGGLALGMEYHPVIAKLHGSIMFGVLAPVLAAAAALPVLAKRGRKEKKGRKERKERKRKKGKGPWGLALLLLAAPPFLGGCKARELETRRFPLALEVGVRDEKLSFACAWPYAEGGMQEENGESGEMDEKEGNEAKDEEPEVNHGQLTKVLAENPEEAVKKIQNLQDKYVDYSQVKAILWDKSLRKNSLLGRQVLDWLEKTPVLARNILIFDTDRERLNLEQVQKKSRGQAGNYLENLYRNNTEYQADTKTLGEVLYGG